MLHQRRLGLQTDVIRPTSYLLVKSGSCLARRRFLLGSTKGSWCLKASQTQRAQQRPESPCPGALRSGILQP